MRKIPSLKARFPFSFGVTSYLYPADIAYNLKRLRGVADEMELILFEGKDYSNLPSPRDVRRFTRLTKATGMRFNVHLPLDIDVVSADDAIRASSRESVERIVALTRPLDPLSYTLHVLKDETEPTASWRARVREALSRLPQQHGMFCIETLAWDLREIGDIIAELGYSVCIDIGHLLLRGYDVPEFFRTFAGRVGMVHLHGIDGEKDHVGLSHLAPATLAMIADTLSRERYARSLCLEVFALADFIDSIGPLERIGERCSSS